MPNSFVKVLRFFALRPKKKIRFRALQRLLDLGAASLKRDLMRLTQLGAVERFQKGFAIEYAVDPSSSLWSALNHLVRELSTPETLLKEAMRDVPGVEAAFIFGSVARGTAEWDSDIDLFVIGDNLNRLIFYDRIAEVSHLTGKEINTIRYSKDDLARRLAGESRFVREVLQNEKVWVGGDPMRIAPIAIAAGIPDGAFIQVPAA